jgi:hypothetical protein
MKTYGDSVMKMEDMGLFTTYSRLEGIEIGEKRGIKIGEKRGEKRGIEIGEKQGIEIANAKIVISAADKGASAESISDFTGIPIEQVRNILANRK